MLDIRTPVIKVVIRDFQVADTYLNPTVAGYFVAGQWWQLDPVNDGHVIPIANETPALAFPVWSKRGEPSTQALGRVSVIYAGEFEADTDQFNTNVNYTVGQRLTVANGVLTPLVVGNYCHGITVRTPANNNNKLRFFRLVGAAQS